MTLPVYCDLSLLISPVNCPCGIWFFICAPLGMIAHVGHRRICPFGCRCPCGRNWVAPLGEVALGHSCPYGHKCGLSLKTLPVYYGLSLLTSPVKCPCGVLFGDVVHLRAIIVRCKSGRFCTDLPCPPWEPLCKVVKVSGWKFFCRHHGSIHSSGRVHETLAQEAPSNLVAGNLTTTWQEEPLSKCHVATRYSLQWIPRPYPWPP